MIEMELWQEEEYEKHIEIAHFVDGQRVGWVKVNTTDKAVDFLKTVKELCKKWNNGKKK